MRKTARSLRARRPAQARPFLEKLEDRTLFNVGFAPDALNRNVTAGFAGNQAETTIAVNPANTFQVFAASTPPGGFAWRFSNDGGQTWANSFAAGTLFRSLTLSGAGYTLGGNALALTSGLTAAAAGVNTVAVNLTLGGTQSLTAGAGAQLTLSGTVSGGPSPRAARGS